jgi:multidrug efflux pump subunit AcrA (membrane-fusion protein)
MTVSRSPARPTPRTAPPVRKIPSLDVSGPCFKGVAASLAVCALIAGAALVPVPATVATTAMGRTHAEPVLVRLAEAGVVSKVYVREGADVAQGAPLVSLDTRLLDTQIAGLRRQLDGIRINIGGLKQEADGLSGNERTPPQRQRFAALEAQIATAEQEVLGLEVRLAMAEQERSRTDVRAPAAGRVAKLMVAEGASLAAGGTLAALQPPTSSLTLEAVWLINRNVPVTSGQAVSIRPDDGASWSFMAPWISHWSGTLTGRIDQILSDDARGLKARVAADLALDAARAPDSRERPFIIQLVTGTPTLLDRFAIALQPPEQGHPISSRPSKAALP